MILRHEISEVLQTLSPKCLCPVDEEEELGKGFNICVCPQAKSLTRGNFTCPITRQASLTTSFRLHNCTSP